MCGIIFNSINTNSNNIVYTGKSSSIGSNLSETSCYDNPVLSVSLGISESSYNNTSRVGTIQCPATVLCGNYKGYKLNELIPYLLNEGSKNISSIPDFGSEYNIESSSFSDDLSNDNSDTISSDEDDDLTICSQDTMSTVIINDITSTTTTHDVLALPCLDRLLKQHGRHNITDDDDQVIEPSRKKRKLSHQYSNKKRSNSSKKRSKSSTSNNEYKCQYCGGIWERKESLGGHTLSQLYNITKIYPQKRIYINCYKSRAHCKNRYYESKDNNRKSNKSLKKNKRRRSTKNNNNNNDSNISSINSDNNNSNKKQRSRYPLRSLNKKSKHTKARNIIISPHKLTKKVKRGSVRWTEKETQLLLECIDNPRYLQNEGKKITTKIKWAEIYFDHKSFWMKNGRSTANVLKKKYQRIVMNQAKSSS